jgi:hypothetical protein
MTDDPKKYSEKDQWDDDLDVAPLNYVRPKVQKPILEKAEFDKKKETNMGPSFINYRAFTYLQHYSVHLS